MLLTCSFPWHYQSYLIQQLSLGNSLEFKFYDAVTSCLVSTGSDGEVGWVHVVPVHVHLKTAHIAKLNLVSFNLHKFKAYIQAKLNIVTHVTAITFDKMWCYLSERVTKTC